jgi:hypothetical protein
MKVITMSRNIRIIGGKEMNSITQIIGIAMILLSMGYSYWQIKRWFEVSVKMNTESVLKVSWFMVLSIIIALAIW